MAALLAIAAVLYLWSLSKNDGRPGVGGGPGGMTDAPGGTPPGGVRTSSYIERQSTNAVGELFGEDTVVKSCAKVDSSEYESGSDSTDGGTLYQCGDS